MMKVAEPRHRATDAMLGAGRGPGQGGRPPGGPRHGSLTSLPPYLECEGPFFAGREDSKGFLGTFGVDPPASGPSMRILTAIPVYNEEAHLEPVLAEVLRYTEDVLAVDDGSTDRTPELLRAFPGVRVIRHERNRGYGAGLDSAFRYTVENGFDGLVTIDCDGQHEPRRIPEIAAGLDRADIVSGSRYLKVFDPAQVPPIERQTDQHRGHALAQRVPRPEPHRRLLRVQGVPGLGPREVRGHRLRLRDAAPDLGPGRPA